MLYTNDAIIKRKHKVEKAGKIISAFTYIFLSILLIYNASLIFQTILYPNKTPNVFGIKTYVIISGSMQPEINVGDIVIVKEVGIDTLKEGDVISFRQGQNIITHRISTIKNENGKIRLETKGDSNNVKDTSFTTENEIEGKVIYKIPQIGKISLLLHGKMALFLILVLTYIYISHTSFVTIRKNNRKVKRIKYEEEKFKKEHIE